MRKGTKLAIRLFLALVLLSGAGLALFIAFLANVDVAKLVNMRTFTSDISSVVTEAKTIPGCLRLSKATLHYENDHPTTVLSDGSFCFCHDESKRLTAVSIENACGEDILFAPPALTGKGPLPKVFTAASGRKAFLFGGEGESCKASRSVFDKINGFIDIVKTADPRAKFDNPRKQCSSVSLVAGETLLVAMPFNSVFAFKGMAGDKEALVAGRTIDPDDPAQATAYFLKKAEAGDTQAMVSLAWLYRKAGNDAEMLQWLDKAAEAGEPAAWSWLGTKYAEGEEKDCDKAKFWLGKVAGLYGATTPRQRETTQDAAAFENDYRATKARRKLADLYGFSCGHDYVGALEYLRGSQSFDGTLENARLGILGAQESIIGSFDARAIQLTEEANFWLARARGAKAEEAWQWEKVEQLFDKNLAEDARSKLGGTSRAELEKMVSMQNLRKLALLGSDKNGEIQKALDGDAEAQFRLGRILFAAAVKNHEESYFWSLIVYSYIGNRTRTKLFGAENVLTKPQIIRQVVRARDWKPDSWPEYSLHMVSIKLIDMQNRFKRLH